LLTAGRARRWKKRERRGRKEERVIRKVSIIFVSMGTKRVIDAKGRLAVRSSFIVGKKRPRGSPTWAFWMGIKEKAAQRGGVTQGANRPRKRLGNYEEGQGLTPGGEFSFSTIAKRMENS